MIKCFLKKGLIFVSPFLLFSELTLAKGTVPKPKASMAPSISLKMTLSGDLKEVYQFSGPLGTYLVGAPEGASSSCENKSLFRSVLYRQKKSLEVWMDLVCTLPEQTGPKLQLKPHRFFVDIKADTQTVSLPAFTDKIKTLQVQIQDIVIKAPKL